MSKWKMVKIKEVCEKASSNIAQKDICENDGAYPIYGASGFIKTVDFYVQEEEYIGIVKDGAGVGRVMVLPAKSSVTGTIQYIISNEKVLVRYLANVLTNLELGKFSSGATIPHIYFKNYENIEIPLPPLEEQKRIADILDKATNLIDLRKQQLEKMDSLIKSKFIYMFGDPVTNPKGWDVKKIGELTNVFTGATPNKSIDEYYCGNIPWVKTGEISKEYIWEAEERITKKALKETNCKIFPINTIMVAMYGQGKTRGQAGLLKIEASTNQACAAIVPNESYCTEYLFKLIQLSYETLRSLGRGGNQPNLNLSMIKEFLVMCPPVELQNQFAEFVEQVEKQKAVMQQSLEKMETNYKALMQEYFG